MKTFSPRPHDIVRRWYVVDADGAVLGRLASEVAKILRGKHKPIFSPHADTGDHVVVVNARSVRVTGGKETEKTYYRHSGYPGGLREIGYARLLAERPVLAVEKAIRGMLPKNRLGRQMFRKLSVYEGAEHPHQAQKPSSLRLGEIPKWEGLPQREAARPPEPAPGGQARGRGKSVAATEQAERRKPAKRPSAKRPSAKRASAKSASGATARSAPARGRAARRSAPKTSTAKASTAKSRATPRRAARTAAKSEKAAESKKSSSTQRSKSKKES